MPSIETIKEIVNDFMEYQRRQAEAAESMAQAMVSIEVAILCALKPEILDEVDA